MEGMWTCLSTSEWPLLTVVGQHPQKSGWVPHTSALCFEVSTWWRSCSSSVLSTTKDPWPELDISAPDGVESHGLALARTQRACSEKGCWSTSYRFAVLDAILGVKPRDIFRV